MIGDRLSVQQCLVRPETADEESLKLKVLVTLIIRSWLAMNIALARLRFPINTSRGAWYRYGHSLTGSFCLAYGPRLRTESNMHENRICVRGTNTMSTLHDRRSRLTSMSKY